MTEQHALFPEPHFTDRYSVGDRVRSTHTGNEGRVVTVVTGRHLMIRWNAWSTRWVERESYIVRHSSPSGLERLS